MHAHVRPSCDTARPSAPADKIKVTLAQTCSSCEQLRALLLKPLRKGGGGAVSCASVREEGVLQLCKLRRLLKILNHNLKLNKDLNCTILQKYSSTNKLICDTRLFCLGDQNIRTVFCTVLYSPSRIYIVVLS